MSAALRVLVVEDSLTVRRHIVAVLGAAPGIEVVGEAADGREAIALCEALRPDVLTLDMILPGVDGLAVTEHVMAYFPTPILVVSSSTNRGELFTTYDALAAGAVDVLDKSGAAAPAWDAALVDAVRMVARIRVISHPRARLGPRTRAVSPRKAEGTMDLAAPATHAYGGRGRTRVVAVGVSTGGPGALVELFRGLTPTFPVPVLLVIHIAEAFGAALAEWLAKQVGADVTIVADSQPLPPVARRLRVFMAAPDRHLVVTGGRLAATRDAPRHSCRPSVDVLFESVAAELGPSAAACLLTGMGRDGAKGLLAVRRAGGLTLAQDEATSVVFGMPRAAAELDAAVHVVGLPHVAPTLAAWAATAATAATEGGSR